MKPLSIIPANDTFRALQNLVDVYEGKKAVFITAPEINGLMPQGHGLEDFAAEDTALIIESSGSTGKPKKIQLSLDAMKFSANASAKRLGGHGQWILALPINYIAGVNVLFRSIVADTVPIMMNTAVPFTAEAFFRSASYLSDARKYTSLVPIQLQRLIDAAKANPGDLARLREFSAILVGGQQVPSELIAEAKGLGVNVVESYGMSETCGGCVYDGVALDGVSVEIVNDLISIAGPVLANGLGKSFLTNDLGEMRAGILRVLGRRDRVIISGGLKISLDSVEEFAAGLQGVASVALTPVENQFGQGVAVVYSGAEGIEFEELADKFGVAAKPVKVIRVEVLPMLPNQKPDLLAISALVQG